MDGTVLRWAQGEYSGGMIQGFDRKCDVSGGDVEADCIGRVFLVNFEPVVFDTAPARRRSNGKLGRHRAVNVRRPWRVTNINPSTHREVCLVLDENWVSRIVGGFLTVERGEVQIFPNQVVEVSVKSPSVGTTWRALSLKVIHENADEFPWDSVPILPEIQEPAEQESIIIEPKSILLSDRFRNKKLRDIGIRKVPANV